MDASQINNIITRNEEKILTDKRDVRLKRERTNYSKQRKKIRKPRHWKRWAILNNNNENNKIWSRAKRNIWIIIDVWYNGNKSAGLWKRYYNSPKICIGMDKKSGISQRME